MLIVDMPMPKNCGECPLLYMEIVKCTVNGNDCTEYGAERPAWCPIKGELPETHGRLVDADACSSVLRKLENGAKTNTEKLCYGYAARMFEEAFTIIAAESEADADYQLSVLMQEYFERYEPTYNSEDGSM